MKRRAVDVDPPVTALALDAGAAAETHDDCRCDFSGALRSIIPAGYLRLLRAPVRAVPAAQ